MNRNKNWLLFLMLAMAVLALIAFFHICSAYMEAAGGAGALSLPRREPLLAVCMGVSVVILLVCTGLILYVAVKEKKARRDFEHAMLTDPLTGLANREGFQSGARKLIDTARGARYAIVDFDINDFEKFNFIYSHDGGDEVLRQIGRVLREVCGKDELAARIEADHFVCLVRGASFLEIKKNIIYFDKKLQPLKHGVSILLSYGVYMIENYRDPISVMLDRATAAKNVIKGNFEQFIGVYDEELYRKQVEDSAIIGHMAQALRQREFVPYYQPKYDVRTERIVGAEALVRWILPDGTVIMPDRFIGLLEENGLIAKLDWYVFESVCSQLSEMMKDGLEPVPVSTNFSRAHLYDNGFSDRLEEIAARYGVSPELLEIEMTESMFFDNADKLIKMMEAVHEKGFHISIDDFGTGYSSLNMLKDTQFDVLKLDKAFMAQSSTERGRTIIRSILSLAKELNMTTLAEGVSQRGQVEFLRQSGCDIIQGYYFSKPVDANQFADMLKAAGNAVNTGRQPVLTGR